MPGRTKRAAAAAAESKIKKVLEESINEDRKKGTTAATEKKRPSSTVFDFDGMAPRPHKRRATRKQEAKSKPRNDEGEYTGNRKQKSRSSHVEQSPGFHSLANLLYSSDASLSSFLSSSGPKKGKRVVVEIATVEKARMEHQRRRSLRSINSTGPMHLSYRTSYRMSLSDSSPTTSPILSTTLRFTPVAHLPTTPIPRSSNTRRVPLDLHSAIGSCR